MNESFPLPEQTPGPRPEAVDWRARAHASEMLRSLLLGAIVWLAFQLAVAVPLIVVRRLETTVLCGLGLMVSIVCLALLRMGRLQMAMLLFLCGTWFGTLICAILSGGIRSVYLVLHMALPVIAGLLLGRRACAISLAATAFTTLAMAAGEATGYPFPRYFPMPPLAAWNVFLLALMLTTVPVMRTLATLGGALRVAREQTVRFSHAASHDSLTGLPNRALLLERLGGRMTKGHNGVPYALLFLDLDRFKVINDTLGHAAGDRLLALVAERLSGVVSDAGMIARLGGDEFAVLIARPGDPAQVMAVAERLVRAMDAPFPIGGHDLFLTVSIGVGLSNAAYERPEDLLRDADTAMYHAKALGIGRYVVFEEEMRRTLLSSAQVERDLRLAMDRHEFVLYYEPVVALSSGAVAGYEAVLRWRHPVHGAVNPTGFIACAEEAGLVEAIDRWVIDEACRQLAVWRDAGLAIPVSINVSGLSARGPDFSAYLGSRLEHHRVNPKMLSIEISEQALAAIPERLSLLAGVQALGAELVLDDFGSGYSSLGYISRLPISHLKMDRALTSRLGCGERDAAVIRSVLSLAEPLGIRVTAKGLESREHMELARSLGCDYAQGYYFGYAVEAPEVTRRHAEGASAPGSDSVT